MDPLPPLRGLQAFEATARRLSFSAAAAELGVTHGAVSRQVRQLEEDLGVTLLYRTSGSATRLTPAGVRLQARLQQAFDLIAEGIEAVRTPVGLAALSVPAPFALKWLAPRLPRFKSDYPAIELRVKTGNERVTFDHDDLDLAIRDEEDLWDDAIVEPLTKGLCLVLPPAHHQNKAADVVADWLRQQFNEV